VEEEGKSEGNRFGYFFLNLSVSLIVLTLPNFGNNQQMLDEALKSIEPNVGLFVRICLHYRDANYIH
jgi:hypothetical protein